MSKQHISMFRVGILIGIMLFSVLLLSSNVKAFSLFENYDNVSTSDFTGGTISATYNYNSTNGYAQKRNSFSQNPYIPKYFNITTLNPNISYRNLYKIVCDYCGSPNSFYSYQGITYKNTSGFQENMFIAQMQGDVALYNRTFWVYIRNQTSWTGYKTIFNFSCGTQDFSINNWYGIAFNITYVSATTKQFTINVFNITTGSLYCSNSTIIENTTLNNPVNWVTTSINDGCGTGCAYHSNDNTYLSDLTNEYIFPSYVTPTETNNSVIYRNYIYVNVSLNISNNLRNITIYLYDNSGSLIASYTNTTYPFFVNFTNLNNSRYYYNSTAYDTAGNYNATITQQVNTSVQGNLSGSAFWRFRNDYVNYTINLTSGTSTGEYNQNTTYFNIPVYVGIYNITIISKNSTTINNCTYLNVAVTFQNITTLSNCSFFDGMLNISVKNSTSINITNYTITITSFNNSYSETYNINSTSGLAMINITQNFNYTIGIDAQSNLNYIYAYNNFTLNITGNSWFNTSLRLTNSVNITIYTEGTSNRINIPFNITFIQENSETTLNYINGTAFFWNFSVGNLEIKIPTTNTTGYSQRIYNVIINNRSTQDLSAYLIQNPYMVVFNVVDYNSGLNIESALITMYVQLNSTWNAVSSQYSDITGRVQFVYAQNQRYRFYVVKTGYTTKVFDLDSIIFSSYTIPLTSSSSSSNTQDYAGISLTYSPSQYWNGLNNFSFYIANPYGQLLSYGYNLSYPNGQVNNSGTNSIGQILTSLNFNISTADFRDKVTLVYWYQINGSNLKTYSRQFDILGITSNWTLMNNFNNTYGLGDFERVLVSTLVVIIIAGIVGLVIGALWGVATGFIIYLYLSYIGFLSWWFLLLPFIATLLIIWARSGSNG